MDVAAGRIDDETYLARMKALRASAHAPSGRWQQQARCPERAISIRRRFRVDPHRRTRMAQTAE
jgi:hypothetical protein